MTTETMRQEILDSIEEDKVIAEGHLARISDQYDEVCKARRILLVAYGEAQRALTAATLVYTAALAATQEPKL